MAKSIRELFKNTLIQMDLVYSQNYEEKGDSWCKMKVIDLRTKFFEEYHEFADPINAASKTETNRFFELIDVLLVGLMLAERWFPELIAKQTIGMDTDAR